MMRSTRQVLARSALVGLGLVLGLVPAPVLSQYSAPPFLTEFLVLPWGEPSSALPSPKSWQITVDRIWDQDSQKYLQGSDYAVRKFEKSGPKVRLIVHTHMAPSLKTQNEFLSLGSIVYQVGTQIAATHLRKDLKERLTAQGYLDRVSKPTDAQWWRLDFHKKAWNFQKGELAGQLHIDRTWRKDYTVTLTLWHSHFEAHYRMEKWEALWETQSHKAWFLPPRLVSDLKHAKIEAIIGAENWNMVQRFSRQKGWDISAEEQVKISLPSFLSMYEHLEQAIPTSPEPLALQVLQNFLGEYMTWVIYHDVSQATVEQKTRLQRNQIKIIYREKPLYVDTRFIQLADEHLDTYWGQ